MPAPKQRAVNVGTAAMARLKASEGGSPSQARGGRDEYGRLIEFTGSGFYEAGDIITYAKKTGAFNQAGSIISYGKSTVPPKEPLPDYSPKKYVFGMDETTLPGDLLLRKSGLPIKSRMAALIRQRSIDMATLMMDFLQRPGFSRLPARGHALVDIPTFRRCLCYAFGEQWSSLAMTSPEFLETYSTYIVREQTESGDALVSWKAFCTDIMKTAGVDKGDLGYLKAEASLSERASVTNQEQDDLTEEQKAELQRVIDAEFSHDIETEEEAQALAATRVERVTGARSVAVTRYGSYEAKLHGRNSLGVIKQGEFDAIGETDADNEARRRAQGINADGSRVKSVNQQVSGQTHEFAADGSIEVSGVDIQYDAKAAANATSYSAGSQASSGKSGALSNTDAVAKARQAQADAEAKRQMKALKFQQMMQAKFGKEVENQIDEDDDQDAAAVNTSTYYAGQLKEKSMVDKKAPPPSGGYAAITKTDVAFQRGGR